MSVRVEQSPIAALEKGCERTQNWSRGDAAGVADDAGALLGVLRNAPG
jgi:hypothetical protein